MPSKSQIRFLQSAAHPLHPLVRIGARGLTAAVHKEIDGALEAHELIKIKFSRARDEKREAMIDEIGKRQRADCVQKIGHVAVFYRRNAEKGRYSLPQA